jgi:Tol biopolymer transport system component
MDVIFFRTDGLWYYDSALAQERQLVANPSESGRRVPGSLTWAPDTEHVAYLTYREEDKARGEWANVTIVELATGVTTQLTAVPIFIPGGLAWSLAGTELYAIGAFKNGEETAWGLYAFSLTPETAPEMLLTERRSGAGLSGPIQVTPEGHVRYVHFEPREIAIRQLHPPEGEVKTVALIPGTSASPFAISHQTLPGDAGVLYLLSTMRTGWEARLGLHHIAAEESRQLLFLEEGCGLEAGLGLDRWVALGCGPAESSPLVLCDLPAEICQQLHAPLRDALLPLLNPEALPFSTLKFTPIAWRAEQLYFTARLLGPDVSDLGGLFRYNAQTGEVVPLLMDLEEAVLAPSGAVAATGTPLPTPTTGDVPPPETRPGQACLVAELPLLENHQGRVRRFAWSPTGEALAYVAPDETHAGVLWLAEAPDFDSPQQVARPANNNPTWSPDGTRLAFVARRPADELGTVMIVAADGTNARDLFPGEQAQTDPGAGFKAIEGWWDPKRLVVATNCGSGCRRPLALDLAQQTREALLAPGREGSSYAWSPDRRALVVTAGFNPQIGVRPQHAEEITWLSGHGASEPDWAAFWTFFADWSPDGTHVLFLRQLAGGTEPPELWTWELETGAASLLLPGVVAAQWAPDGERIAFLTWGRPDIDDAGRWTDIAVDPQGPNPLGVGLYHRATGDIVTFFEIGEVTFDHNNPAGTPPIPLTLAWSPDGSRLIYGDGTGQAGLLAADGATHYPLPAQEQPPGRNARWSPDGRWLALPDGNSLRIYAVPCAP